MLTYRMVDVQNRLPSKKIILQKIKPLAKGGLFILSLVELFNGRFHISLINFIIKSDNKIGQLKKTPFLKISKNHFHLKSKPMKKTINTILMLFLFSSAHARNKEAETFYNNGDFTKAFNESMISAKQGGAKAQFAIGVMYEYGKGVKKDISQSIAWYLKAAEQEYDKAQHNLAELYHNGRGVNKNAQLAMTWYHKAAEQGLAKAQFNLGVMYADTDVLQTAIWWRKAAEQGYARAQHNLGVLFLDGQGVKKDPKVAKLWFGKACYRGNKMSCRNYQILDKQGY